jgi:hypothetical protein
MYHIHRNFVLEKNFAKPSYFCIAETFGGINFTNESRWRNWRNFLLVKISTYTVSNYQYIMVIVVLDLPGQPLGPPLACCKPLLSPHYRTRGSPGWTAGVET